MKDSSTEARPVSPPPQPDLSALIQGYGGRLSRAVQANLRYPPAAQAMGRGGQAQVQFFVVSGRVLDVRVLRSSGSSLLDEAAVVAVRTLRCPPLPEALAHTKMPFTLWVHFDPA